MGVALSREGCVRGTVCRGRADLAVLPGFLLPLQQWSGGALSPGPCPIVLQNVGLPGSGAGVALAEPGRGWQRLLAVNPGSVGAAESLTQGTRNACQEPKYKLLFKGPCFTHEMT